MPGKPGATRASGFVRELKHQFWSHSRQTASAVLRLLRSRARTSALATFVHHTTPDESDRST